MSKLKSNIDKQTKELIGLLDSVKGHGIAKIITVTDGDDFIKKFSDRTRSESRPDWLNGIKKITMHLVNVGHGYDKMIKNQLKKIGKNPEDFNPEACKYSIKFSDNGLVRQNTKDERAFYLRYFVGVNTKYFNSYEDIFLNEQDQIVEIDQATKDKWFNAKGKSKKQASAGVVKEIKPRNVRMDNLFYFQRGQGVFNRLTERMLELLNLEIVED